jgi:hypothetical protein
VTEYVRSFPCTAGPGSQKDSEGSSLALILHIFFNLFVFVYSNYVPRTHPPPHSLPASIARSPKEQKVSPWGAVDRPRAASSKYV